MAGKGEAANGRNGDVLVTGGLRSKDGVAYPARLPASPTGDWTIWSLQRRVPWVPPAIGTHNYVALVDPKGRIDDEFHGSFEKGMTIFGGRKGNLLDAQHYGANGLMAENPLTFGAPVIRGPKAAVAPAYWKGTIDAQASLWRHRNLYDGGELIGDSANSNSVWSTTMKAMAAHAGVEVNPRRFLGGFGAPGAQVDLRTHATNNPDGDNPMPLPSVRMGPLAPGGKDRMVPIDRMLDDPLVDWSDGSGRLRLGAGPAAMPTRTPAPAAKGGGRER